VLSLPKDHPSDIEPVLLAIRERFENDEVFRATGDEIHVESETMAAGSGDDSFLEGQRSQRYIERDAILRSQENNSGSKGEISSIRAPGLEAIQKGSDPLFFRAKTSQDGQVHVLCEARLPPALYRYRADDTKSPAVLPAEFLNRDGCRENWIH
jgi:hypothetical protein